MEVALKKIREELNNCETDSERLNLHHQIASQKLWYFAYTYLRSYLKYPFAEFHGEIFDAIEDNSSNLDEFIAFRESAKSTIITLFSVLQKILYKKKNFIIIVSDTYSQSQLHMANIIYELENNEFIMRDFGDIKSDKWSEGNIVTSTGIRVMAKGTGSKFRGLRHLQYRPDYIVGDDLENVELVRTSEQRDKNQRWLEAEVIPSMDQEVGKMVIVGNMIHYDGLMARLKKREAWRTVEIPVMKDGKPNWESRHTLEKIEKIKESVGSLNFAQEYMLEPIMETDQVIKKSWIRTYSAALSPSLIKELVIAVDPAISEKESADNTAITIWCRYEDGNIYLMDFINEKLSFDKQIKAIRLLYSSHSEFNPTVVIEDVAYQKALIQHLSRTHNLRVKGVRPIGDKRSRLMGVSTYFENGLIFIKSTHEEVVHQITNFGVTRYDDLVDSSIHGINYLLSKKKAKGFANTNLKL